MSDEKKPEVIKDEALKDVSGGITLDNGIKRGITLDNGIKKGITLDNGIKKGAVISEPDLKKR